MAYKFVIKEICYFRHHFDKVRIFSALPDYSLDDTVRNLPIGDWYDVDPFHDKRLSCDTNKKTNNFGY